MKPIEFTKIDTRLTVKKTLDDKKQLRVHKQKADKSKQVKVHLQYSVESTKRGWTGR